MIRKIAEQIHWDAIVKSGNPDATDDDIYKAAEDVVKTLRNNFPEASNAQLFRHWLLGYQQEIIFRKTNE